MARANSPRDCQTQAQPKPRPDWRFATAVERHRPPHGAWNAGAVYITASTFERARHIATPERKHRLLDMAFALGEALEIELVAWVVLDEHYHVILVPHGPASYSEWLKKLHADSSREWNGEDQCRGRQCWYQYWDVTLRTEGDLWTRINYIHRNPVKHGYVRDTYEWPWSSLKQFDELWTRPENATLRDRFPAPLKLPHDDFDRPQAVG